MLIQWQLRQHSIDMEKGVLKYTKACVEKWFMTQQREQAIQKMTQEQTDILHEIISLPHSIYKN